MDEFERIAGEYFAATEGRHLYPALRTWHWYAFGVSLGGMAAFFSHVIGRGGAESRGSDTFWVVVLDAVFIVVWLAIRAHRDREMLRTTRLLLGDDIRTIDDCRRAHLTRLCGVPKNQFLAIAKECGDLITLQRTHRLVPELGFEFYARKVYDPDAKARLLTIIMGAIALLSALTVRSLPDDSLSVLALLADGGLWSLIGFLIFVAFMVFGIGLGVHAVWHSMKAVLDLWWTKLTGNTANSELPMRYLMRDLVRLHAPTSLRIKTVARPQEPYEPPEPASGIPSAEPAAAGA